MMNQHVAAPQSQGPQQAGRQEDGQARAKPPMTPAQMLISHEKRLMEIESAFPDMVGKLTREISREFENIKGVPRANTGGDSAASEAVAGLEKRLNDIEATVAGLAKSYKLISDLTTEMNTSMLRAIAAQHQEDQTDEASPALGAESVEREEVDVTANTEPPADEDNADASEPVQAEPSAEEGNEDVDGSAEVAPAADEENEVVAIKSGRKKRKDNK